MVLIHFILFKSLIRDDISNIYDKLNILYIFKNKKKTSVQQLLTMLDEI